MSENATDITNDNIQDNNGNDSLLTGGSLYENRFREKQRSGSYGSRAAGKL